MPPPAEKAATKAHDFVRFSYSLSSQDSLLVRSYEDKGTSMGSYDIGFVVKRDGLEKQSLYLRDLPEMRGEDSDYMASFTTLAVTRACGREGPLFFVTMQYSGDMLSPALLFVLVPSGNDYVVSSLPMISGGVLEVSKVNPLHLRTWDNLNEGECNACATAYQITEYEIRDGKPVKSRRYRTRHLYTSGDYRFDDRRRIRFMP